MWSVAKVGLTASPSNPRSLYPPLRSVVTVGTVANVLTVPFAATRIAPERSAKNNRPSGAHARAVAKCASPTNTDWPGGPLTGTGGEAHGSGGAVTGTVVVGAADGNQAIGLSQAEFGPWRLGRVGAVEHERGFHLAPREPLGFLIDRVRPQHLDPVADTAQRICQHHGEAVVAAIGQFAMVNQDFNALVNQALQLVAETLDVQLAHILELQPETESLVTRAAVGWRAGRSRRPASSRVR